MLYCENAVAQRIKHSLSGPAQHRSLVIANAAAQRCRAGAAWRRVRLSMAVTEWNMLVPRLPRGHCNRLTITDWHAERVPASTLPVAHSAQRLALASRKALDRAIRAAACTVAMGKLIFSFTGAKPLARYDQQNRKPPRHEGLGGGKRK